jgi:hypothetical protein
MPTYDMTFNAKIESVNIQQKQMVVEYFDPHGGDSIRLAITFNYDSTPEELRQLVIAGTPHTTFHTRHEEALAIVQNNIDQQQLLTLVDEQMNYNLPTYTNEVV